MDKFTRFYTRALAYDIGIYMSICEYQYTVKVSATMNQFEHCLQNKKKILRNLQRKVMMFRHYLLKIIFRGFCCRVDP